MRLTLRTLLAYLDDILEPEDHEAIGKKIKDSDFATELVHRTRDVTRRLRLGAPEVMGRGMGQDANTVAEYLDNTLPAERVAEFERVCLESDVHLSEVAACHQILTLVLGEPAEVDVEQRERMYGIPTHAERLLSRRPEKTAAGVPVVENAARAESSDRIVEVPDYLRESARSSTRRIVAVLALAAGLIGAAVYLWWPGGPLSSADRGEVATGHPQASDGTTASGDAAGSDAASNAAAGPGLETATSPGTSTNAEKVPLEGEHGGTTTLQPHGTPPADTTNGQATGLSTPGAPNDGSREADGLGSTEQPVGQPSAAGAATTIEQGETVGEATIEQAPGSPSGEPGVASPAAAAASLDSNVGVSPAAPMPEDSSPFSKGETPLESTTGVGATPPGLAVDATITQGGLNVAAGAVTPHGQTSDASVLDTTSTEGAVAPSPMPEQPASQRVGSFVFDQKQVLLRYDGQIDEWRRVETNSVQQAGERLLSLPTYRPSGVLDNGVMLTMVDGTLITLGKQDDTLTVAVDYGRAIFTNPSPDPQHVMVGIAEDWVDVELQPQSKLAVEVVRHIVLGADPRKVPGEIKAEMTAISGTIRWGAEANALVFEAPSVWYVSGGTLDVGDAMVETPKWVGGQEDLNLVEQMASVTVEQQLELNRSARLSLRELVHGPHEEVRSLAARASLYVGQFDPFMEALNDPEIAPAWRPKLIRSLCEATALGPDVAQAVAEAFQRTGTQSNVDPRFRMLWGYTREQLAEGKNKELVEYLDHDRLDYRLLALWNLVEITGKGSKEVLTDPRANNGSLIRRWRDRLKSGEVLPAAAEQPAG